MRTESLYTFRLVRWYPTLGNARSLPWIYRSDDRTVRAFRLPFTYNVDQWGAWYALAIQFRKP